MNLIEYPGVKPNESPGPNQTPSELLDKLIQYASLLFSVNGGSTSVCDQKDVCNPQCQNYVCPIFVLNKINGRLENGSNR